MPPTLSVCNTDSLAEQLQRACPAARVVKGFNTMSCEVMVAPSAIEGHHTAFIAGEDAEAKQTVRSLMVGMGWPEEDIMDLGGLDAARGMEMYLPLWLRLFMSTGSRYLNVEVKAG